MLPCDVNPEKRMRERFVKREADMRHGLTEAVKVKVSTTTPVWVVEVQFDNADYERDRSDDPRMLTDSFVDSFMRFASEARLTVEERVRENRVFVQVPARTTREAEKVVKDLVAKSVKHQRDKGLGRSRR